MKYLIAGLGNIGSQYENTRHNIGFSVLDELANSSSISFSTDKLASVAKFRHRGRQVVMIKPSTYMNLSGKAINYWLQKEKIKVENLLIITDDLALPFGKIRVRGKGSDGGHNGLKDIQQWLNTNQYPRLRFGIGSDFPKGKQVDYVLKQWTKEEQEKIGEHIEYACKTTLNFISLGLVHTMNHFNKKEV